MLFLLPSITFNKTQKNKNCLKLQHCHKQNKKKVFWVMGLKNLARVGHILFSLLLFMNKKKNLCILKGEVPFKMYKIIFFSENLKKILGYTSKLGRVTLNTDIFYLALDYFS